VHFLIVKNAYLHESPPLTPNPHTKTTTSVSYSINMIDIFDFDEALPPSNAANQKKL